MGCLAVMAAALGGCGKEEGAAVGNGAGVEAAPEAGGENAPDASAARNNGEAPDKSSQETENEGNDGENQAESPAAATGTTVTQGGPFGAISLTVPEGWKYELCPMDSDSLLIGDYGICFFV